MAALFSLYWMLLSLISPSLSNSSQDLYCECWTLPNCLSNCSSLLAPEDQATLNFLHSLPKPFSISRPQQVRRGQIKFDVSTASKRGYYTSTLFDLRLPSGNTVRLTLKKSDVFEFEGGYSTLSYRKRQSGDTSEVESDKLENCFYTGKVGNFDGAPDNTSFAAVGTCSGLKGAIFYQNGTFLVQPLPCLGCDPSSATHVVYWTPSEVQRVSSSSHLRTFWRPVDLMSMPIGPQKGVAGTSAYNAVEVDTVHTIWLDFIIDGDLLNSFGGNLSSAVRYVSSLVNLAHMNFRNIPVQLHLFRTQVWNMGNRIKMEPNIKATLNNLQRYRTDHSPFSDGIGTIKRSKREASPLGATRSINNADDNESAHSAMPNNNRPPASHDDILFLLTASRFDDNEGVEHIAIPGSICTPRATAIIKVNPSAIELQVAHSISQSIAEILGIHSFPCPSMYKCDSQQVFSSGDVSRIRLALLSDMSACLRPFSLSDRVLLRIDTCGNGVVDRGEECDPQYGVNINLRSSAADDTSNSSAPTSGSCCDPRTCLASINAVCVHGSCCRGCQLVTRGRLCRPARDQCDLPEFCSGTQPECPVDMYLENGLPCRAGVTLEEEDNEKREEVREIVEGQFTRKKRNKRGQHDEELALCYEGRCPTRSSHCRAMWGAPSVSADRYCYQTRNKDTDSSCGSGVKCEEEHTMCGLLHCQGGQTLPLLEEARALQIFNVLEHRNNQSVECKYIPSIRSFSFVPEGASCDKGRFCFRNRCVKSSLAVQSKCPLGEYSPSGIGESELSAYVHPSVRENLPSTPGNVTCSGRGICTNAAFCLCPPGWHGPTCSVRLTPDVTSEGNKSAVKKTMTKYHPTSSADASISFVYPDEDIVSLMWMYLQAVDKTPEPTLKSAPVNTVYLISILGAVILGVFLCLSLFLIFYRRRGVEHGFPFGSKSARQRFPLSNIFSVDVSNRHLKREPLGKISSPGNATDSVCLCNRNSRPVGSVDNMDQLEDYSSNKRSRPCSRNRRRYKGGRGSRSRRHGHKRHAATASSGESFHSQGGGTEGCGAESGPELGGTCEEGRTMLEKSYADRMIKFGSMPSYREDKIKRDKVKDTPIVISSGTSPLQSKHLIDLSAQPQPLVTFSNSSSPHNGSLTATVLPWSVNSGYVSPPVFSNPGLFFNDVSSVIMVPPPPPSVSKSASPVSHLMRQSSQVPPLPSTTFSDFPVGQMVPTTNFMEQQTSKKVMTTSAISGEESETQVTVILDQSWRQPEKGILKNKHKGSAPAGGNGGRNKSRNQSKSKKRHGHRQSSNRNEQNCSKCRDCSSDDSDGDYDVSNITADTNQVSFSSSSSCSSSSTEETSFVDRQQFSNDSSNSSAKAGEGNSSVSEESIHSGNERKKKHRQHRRHNHNRRDSNSSSDGGSTCSTALEVCIDGFGDREDRKKKGHRHKHRHHKKHCKKHRQSRRNRGGELSDDGMDGAVAMDQQSVITPETSSSSPSTGLHSSSASSLSRGNNRRRHRRRRLNRRHKVAMSVSDAETVDSTAHGSVYSVQHPVPTILCNAGQQTDEMSLLRAAGSICNPHTEKPSKTIPEEIGNEDVDVEGLDDSEWEEVECTGSDCEECRRTSAVEVLSAAGDHRIPFYPPPPPPSVPNFGSQKRADQGCLASGLSSSVAFHGLVPTPSAGGLLHQYSTPSVISSTNQNIPPMSSDKAMGRRDYYCTTQICAAPFNSANNMNDCTETYYQPPIEDVDSNLMNVGANGGYQNQNIASNILPHHRQQQQQVQRSPKFSTPEDDGLINRYGPSPVSDRSGRQNGSTGESTPAGSYHLDSDGLARKNSNTTYPKQEYSRSNYTESDSDLSFSAFTRDFKKNSPIPHEWSNESVLSGDGSINQDGTHGAAHLRSCFEKESGNSSFDGNCAESDASSLPDASCDLVHLAQLTHASRTNPNLSDLARHQQQIRLACNTQAPAKNYNSFALSSPKNQ